MTVCGCTLHPRKGHTDPCRACHAKHAPAPRSAVASLGLGDGPLSRVSDPTQRTTATRGASQGQTSDRIPSEVVTARFLAKVDKSGECWIWTGCVGRNGYGQMTAKGYSTLVHRAAYELFVGPIPAGLQVDHLCRVALCVNPDHLEAVTPAENNRRTMPFRDIRTRTHCPRGHAFANTGRWRSDRGSVYRYCRTCEQLRQEGVALGAPVLRDRLVQLRAEHR